MAERPSGERAQSPAWGPCPPGTFAGLADRLQRRSQRRAFLGIAGITAAVGVVGGGLALWLGLLEGGRTSLAALTCAEALRLVEPCRRGELTPADRERLRRHLASCCHCADYYRSLGLMVCAPLPDDPPAG
jgi:hypothetical protein